MPQILTQSARFIATCLVLFAFVAEASAVSRNIGGLVQLEGGVFAIADISIVVSLTRENAQGNQTPSIIRHVVINSGENSTSYEFLDIDLDDTDKVFVSYACSANCDGLVSFAFIGSDGMVGSFVDEVGFPASSDLTSIDLTILNALIVQGTFTLPDGPVIESEFSAFVSYTAISNTDEFIASEGDFLSIAVGQSAVEYSLSFFPDPNILEFEISYSCSNRCNTYFGTGYFTSTGSTFDIRQREPISRESAISGITFDAVPGVTISGSIALAENAAADEDITLNITAALEQVGGSIPAFQAVTILKDSNSATYSINAPRSDSGFIFVEYRCSPFSSSCDTSRFANGSYRASGTSSFFAGDTLDPSISHTGIDMTLIEFVSFSGTLLLPNNETAADDLALRAQANSFSSLGVLRARRSQSVVIAAGENSAPFEVIVPAEPGLDIILSYTCRTLCSPYGVRGFLGSDDTLATSDDAMRFDGAQTSVDNTIELIRTNTVSGFVSRSEFGDLPSGFAFDVVVDTFNQNDELISSNRSSRSSPFVQTYFATVKSIINGYRIVRYECTASCDDVFTVAYIGDSANESVLSSAAAARLPSDQDINRALVILGKSTGRGSLTLNSENLPAAQRSFSVSFITSRNGQEFNYGVSLAQTLNFTAADTAKEFNIELVDVIFGERIAGYQCISRCDGVLVKGYYSSNGTVANIADATVLSGTEDLEAININILIDSDADGVPDQLDNCPLTSNTNQDNSDDDPAGDSCDSDDDNDGVDDIDDNCQFLSNADQIDTDKDGFGNDCDLDDDEDTVLDDLDNCPLISNQDQIDSNEDGVGDACTDNSICFPVPTKNGATALICL